MDILRIDKTEFTPAVIFDADEMSLSIIGASRPENAQEFYEPLKIWLGEFNSSKNVIASVPLNIQVKISYFNSPSLIELLEVFKTIRLIHKKGQKVLVDWHYDKDDELIFETAQDISDIIEIPFNFIED